MACLSCRQSIRLFAVLIRGLQSLYRSFLSGKHKSDRAFIALGSDK
jgi:hypothetical protein